MNAEARGTARDILAELAAQSATGRLVLQHPDRGHSWIWLRDGLLCSVSTAGEDGLLGALLIQQGQLAAEQLANLLARAREAPVPSDLSAVAVTSGALPPEVVYRARCVVLGHALHRAVSRGVVATHFLGGDVFPTLTEPVNVADAFAAGAQQAPTSATFTGSVAPPAPAQPTAPPTTAPLTTVEIPEPAQPGSPAPATGVPPGTPPPAASPAPAPQQSGMPEAEAAAPVADLRDPRSLLHGAGSRGVPPNEDLAALAEKLNEGGDDSAAGTEQEPKAEKSQVKAKGREKPAGKAERPNGEEDAPKKKSQQRPEPPPKPREQLRYRPDHAAMRELQELGRILNEED